VSHSGLSCRCVTTRKPQNLDPANLYQTVLHPRPQAQARAALTVALGQAVEQLIVIGSFALKECCGWEGNAG
jgi:hypothetical protein